MTSFRDAGSAQSFAPPNQFDLIGLKHRELGLRDCLDTYSSAEATRTIHSAGANGRSSSYLQAGQHSFIKDEQGIPQSIHETWEE